MADIDRGHRPQFRAYGGDRRLEIVSGKVYSSTHPPLVTRSSRHRSPGPPLPSSSSLPPTRKAKGSRGLGCGWGWGFNDPEMKRRSRVASYKAYAVEGKVKASLRKGARWIKIKCSQIVGGF